MQLNQIEPKIFLKNNPSPSKKNTADVLILGSDSQIGSVLNKYLIKNNIAVTGTTYQKTDHKSGS